MRKPRNVSARRLRPIGAGGRTMLGGTRLRRSPVRRSADGPKAPPIASNHDRLAALMTPFSRRVRRA